MHLHLSQLASLNGLCQSNILQSICGGCNSSSFLKIKTDEGAVASRLRRIASTSARLSLSSIGRAWTKACTSAETARINSRLKIHKSTRALRTVTCQKNKLQMLMCLKSERGTSPCQHRSVCIFRAEQLFYFCPSSVSYQQCFFTC